MSRVVVIYVGKASQTNLSVGLANGIWGFKERWDGLERIQPGDLVLLGSQFSGGSPRVKLASWQQESIGRIEGGVVTSAYYEDRSQVWPDEDGEEVSYPHRFRFEHTGTTRDVPLGPEGPLGTEVADGLRLSAVNRGRAYVLDEPEGFAFRDSAPAQTTPEPQQVPPPAEPAGVRAIVAAFLTELDRAGLHLEDDLATRFLCSALAKPFVICAGLSGAGKTQLALALGRWLGAPDRLHVAAVRPDWTGAEALFGFENMLVPPSEDGRPGWSVPAQLRFMLQSADDPDEPHVLVLDEMNLAHVERYFADVLSGMESGEPVLPNLVEEPDGIWRVPADAPQRLAFPKNLIVIGTVNMDETTYQFSPKVLDRSMTLEFRVSASALGGAEPDLTKIGPATEGTRRGVRSAATSNQPWPSETLSKRVTDLHRLLAAHGREFGHRTFHEMRRYASLASAGQEGLDDDRILDHLVVQKVLPRISGSARELRGVIEALTEFCQEGGSAPMSISLDKLSRMTVQMEATHFTAF